MPYLFFLFLALSAVTSAKGQTVPVKGVETTIGLEREVGKAEGHPVRNTVLLVVAVGSTGLVLVLRTRGRDQKNSDTKEG